MVSWLGMRLKVRQKNHQPRQSIAYRLRDNNREMLNPARTTYGGTESE